MLIAPAGRGRRRSRAPPPIPSDPERLDRRVRGHAQRDGPQPRPGTAPACARGGGASRRRWRRWPGCPRCRPAAPPGSRTARRWPGAPPPRPAPRRRARALQQQQRRQTANAPIASADPPVHAEQQRPARRPAAARCPSSWTTKREKKLPSVATSPSIRSISSPGVWALWKAGSSRRQWRTRSARRRLVAVSPTSWAT